MNGLEKDMIDRRPLVTCAGELEVFSAIEDNLLQSLPKDSADWKRSLGRPVRSVHIGANFVPFSSVGLPRGTQWDIIRQPLFHIYWTECNDVDVYKASLREDIETWLRELTVKDIQDWLIVVVENFDGKRANKLLPRTTVLDKIRADFAPKQGDRCISVINPGKSESADSWKGLVNRIRHLLLVAYAKAVSRLEDHVRQQRERRNDTGWKFMNYFHLQEELAQVLEMLGLYDEALVQYDELDALFSQFVVNGVTCESVAWLSDFQMPLERWHALKLGPSQLQDNPSILELRAYLFAKQAHMMLLTDKVWQMASRCLPFLHTCTREMSILEIVAPNGALDCWLFLAAMEVLQTCDKLNNAGEVEAYSSHTAPLWAYASQKLKALGELCGLLPGNKPSSEQLHIVVGLSAGMGDNPGTPIAPSPTDKLKKALCSQEIFKKTYLDLAELAMGTYKHTGRVRSARLIGREMASFYMLLGDVQKAAAFLKDALRLFRKDGWFEVAAQSQKELADCYRHVKDWTKFVESSVRVSACVELDTLDRWSYFDEMCKQIKNLSEPVDVPLNEVMRIQGVSLKNRDPIIRDEEIEVEFTLESNFPRGILCTKIFATLEEKSKVTKDKHCDSTNITCKNPGLKWLKIVRHLDYKQDKQLFSANVVCKLKEKHQKAHENKSGEEAVPENSASPSLSADVPFVLTPGINHITLKCRGIKQSENQIGKLVLHLNEMLRITSKDIQPKITITLRDEPHSIMLHKSAAPLLAGVEQTMTLIVTVGSSYLDPSTLIQVTASRGLLLQVDSKEPLASSCKFIVGTREMMSSKKISLRVLADMTTKKHEVIIHAPWMVHALNVPLSFTPPLTCNWKLHTVKKRKFILVQVTVQCHDDLLVDSPCLTIKKDNITSDRNGRLNGVLQDGTSYTYIWELLLDKNSEGPLLNAVFSVTFKIKNVQMESKPFLYNFDLVDYQTLYILDASLEPTKGNEFCRVGFLCHLNLTIENVGDRFDDLDSRSIMYEVLAEQSVWAVCGRTAGVITFEKDVTVQPIVLDIMPLISGFLPLPLVRLSKYIPAEGHFGKNEIHPRLEPFGAGQVYNATKGKQVHVIVTPNDGNL